MGGNIHFKLEPFEHNGSDLILFLWMPLKILKQEMSDNRL